jgi:hypothetical protein
MKLKILARPAAGTRLALFFAVLLASLTGFAGVSQAGLLDAERAILDQAACAQMRTYSQDITLLNDEMQNLKRTRDRRRTCEVIRRAVSTMGDAAAYMRAHIGECTITSASTEQMADLVRKMEIDGRACR